jgi:hypothetical protein
VRVSLYTVEVMRWAPYGLLVILFGCGGESSPTRPTPVPTPAPAPTAAPTPTPAPTRVILTGTITDTLSGATVGTCPARTVGKRPDRSQPLGSGLRSAFGSTSESPTLWPLRVLTAAPSFYIEVEGAKGLSKEVAADLEPVARRIVPALTGGRFQVVRWETGPTPRPEQAGWIVIERRDEAGVCGRALVGGSAGHIWLDANQQGCSFTAVFAHELGHALGFWHVTTGGSLMYRQQRNSNLADAPTERERDHAAIAYRRPVGNRDIDVDPDVTSTSSLRTVIVN